MLARKQSADKWPFSAGGGSSDRSDPPPPWLRAWLRYHYAGRKSM